MMSFPLSVQLFGLPGLLCTISQNCSEERAPLEIFGPLGLKKFLRTSLHLSRSILNYNIAVHELCHGRRPEEIDGIVSVCGGIVSVCGGSVNVCQCGGIACVWWCGIVSVCVVEE